MRSMLNPRHRWETKRRSRPFAQKIPTTKVSKVTSHFREKTARRKVRTGEETGPVPAAQVTVLTRRLPPETTTLPADRSSAAPATPLHRLKTALPSSRANSQSNRDARRKSNQGISDGITSGRVAGKHGPRGYTGSGYVGVHRHRIAHK
jgi:hypothetical protein